jgi:hypothetical protein
LALLLGVLTAADFFGVAFGVALVVAVALALGVPVAVAPPPEVFFRALMCCSMALAVGS